MINLNNINWNDLKDSNIKEIIEIYDESFFIEFKSDDVNNKKLSEEISAFANTYGGYVFIGVNDDKQIEGCTIWNEEKISSVIRDRLSPLPIFDIKKFIVEEKIIYIIRIEEGNDPPYITIDGKIYERISSSSCPIKDSQKLSILFNKRKENDTLLEKKLSIPSIIDNNISNLFGYIDIGFSIVTNNIESLQSRFWDIKIEELSKILFNKFDHSTSVFCTGYSYYISYGAMIPYNKSNIYLPAHTNNFIEIMCDGSVRFRILLINNDNVNEVNMYFVQFFRLLFKKAYNFIFGDIIENSFIYLKKYEKLTVCKQFEPIYNISDELLEDEEDMQILEEYNRKFNEYLRKTGKDIYITDDRIPKTGFIYCDNSSFDNLKNKCNKENILSYLFFSGFSHLNYLD